MAKISAEVRARVQADADAVVERVKAGEHGLIFTTCPACREEHDWADFLRTDGSRREVACSCGRSLSLVGELAVTVSMT